MISSSVGVRDIHTPSVVRIADPAKEVSARWFSVKLLPTDCSPVKIKQLVSCAVKCDAEEDIILPIDDTTRTGYRNVSNILSTKITCMYYLGSHI